MKLIVCDMDGTLLNSKDEISENTKNYLIACQQKGIRLVLASGRSYSRLKEYYEQLRMPEYDGILIEVNGLYTNYLQRGIRQKAKSLTMMDLKKIYDASVHHEPEIITYLDQGIRYLIPASMEPIKKAYIKEQQLPEDYPLSGGPWAWAVDTRGGYPDQKRLYSIDEFPEEVNKMTLLHRPEITQQIIDEFQGNIFEDYEMSRSAPRSLEITAKGVTKGVALRTLMEKENIQSDEVLAFGDGENDFSLFDEVKYAIAMGNAPQYVKDHAYEITATNDEDGVMLACQKYIK